MGTRSATDVKTRYGRFILAASLYISGILFFSIWSYSAQHKTLRTFSDRSLKDAAFAAREIIGSDYLLILADGPDVNTTRFSTKQLRLNRMARHGNYTTIAAATINDGIITPLIAGSCTNDMHAKAIHLRHPFTEDLQPTLLNGLKTTDDDITIFEVKHPLYGLLRYAILYKNKDQHGGIIFLVGQEGILLQQQLASQARRIIAVGISMLILAIPLITLFSRAQKTAAAELSQLNTRLYQDVENQKTRETELTDAIKDLERFNAVSAGRESRIIELKAEVNHLLTQMNREKRYNIDKID